MPFWGYSNQYDLMPQTSGYTMVLDAGARIGAPHDFRFDFGATLALRGDSYNWDAVIPSQAYARIAWKPLSLDLGIKNPDLLYYGADPSLGSLSSTGGNVIMSGNARNMPGYTLSLAPIGVPWTKNHLQICGKLGDYVMTDRRAEGTLKTHNAQLYLLGNFWRFTLGIGIDHWTQWEGRGLKNYIRVLTGYHGGMDANPSDQYNIYGNHLGAEKIFLRYKHEGWSLELRHDIPYDDKSGMRFDNFPDGMNYLVFSFDDKDRWVSDVLFEYDYTMYQSGPLHDSEFDEDGNHIPWHPGLNYFGMDNYFNNGVLKSGWTHYGMTIGTPLFYPTGTRSGSWSRKIPCEGVENNRIRAFHLGLSGKIAKKVPYKLMATYSRCCGTYDHPYEGESPAYKPWRSVKESPVGQFSLGLNLRIPLLDDTLHILPGIYWDQGGVLPNSFAATIGVKYFLQK